MANLGSEVNRALTEYQHSDFETICGSIVRAQAMISKISEFSDVKGRTGELEILKLIMNGLYKNKFEVGADDFLDYFNPFALRLMM